MKNFVIRLVVNAAALVAAKRLPGESSVVTVFPDRMERYFSTELFSEAAKTLG